MTWKYTRVPPKRASNGLTANKELPEFPDNDTNRHEGWPSKLAKQVTQANMFPRPTKGEWIDTPGIWIKVLGIEPGSLAIFVASKTVYWAGAPKRGNSMKIAIFDCPVIIINNLTQIICSLILSTRYPLNLNVNLIIFGCLKYVVPEWTIEGTAWLSVNHLTSQPERRCAKLFRAKLTQWSSLH